MALRGPRFVGRQALAALMVLLLSGFLAVALVFPWHLELVELGGSRGPQQVNVDGRFSRQWTWLGAYVEVAPASGSDLRRFLSDEKTIVGWSEMPHDGAAVRAAYVFSQVFVIIALAFAVSLLLFLILALIARRPGRACARLLRGNAKYVALVIGSLTFGFAILAWTLFFRFPSAMQQDGLCPSMFFDFDPHETNGSASTSTLAWCTDRSIAGQTSLSNVYFRLDQNQSVEVDAHLTWAPSIGWFACVFSSGLLLPILVILACLEAPQEKDEEELYGFLNSTDTDSGYEFYRR